MNEEKNKKIMNHLFSLFHKTSVKLLLIILCALLISDGYSRYIGIVKTAIMDTNIERAYIVCRETRTTGFDWELVKDENGNKSDYAQYVKLDGLDRLNIPTGLDFSNRYIFYIDKKYISTNSTGDNCLTYSVTDWDIIYPVKRGGYKPAVSSMLFESCRYINNNDYNYNNVKFIHFAAFMLFVISALLICIAAYHKRENKRKYEY